MAETWAYCGDCARWYYCPRDAALLDGAPGCPVCKSPPVATRRVETEGVAS